jgi:AcrR family transcriptional regulator
MSSKDEVGRGKGSGKQWPQGDLAKRASSREEVPRDGRAARALRTRQAVADALLDLIDGGELRPTSKSIAERAGVSERTIFQHFEDLETLFSAAAERVGDRIVRSTRYVAAEGPFEDRLESYVSELAFLHEAMTPVRRASRLHAPFSPAVGQMLEWWRGLLRKGIERVFKTELDDWVGEERRDVLESLALIVTWSSWENMRQYSDFSTLRARRVLKQSFRSLLRQPPVERAEMEGFVDDDRSGDDRRATLRGGAGDKGSD